MINENMIKEDLKRLKDYCYAYIEREYGKKQNYIRKTRITKNGLFIYGHKVYAPGFCLVYDIYEYISWYDSNDYEYITSLLDHFVLDCNRLTEYKGGK